MVGNSPNPADMGLYGVVLEYVGLYVVASMSIVLGVDCLVMVGVDHVDRLIMVVPQSS